MTRSACLLLVLTLSWMLPGLAAPIPTVAASQAQLTPAQVRSIAQLKLSRVVVPGYVPAGMKLSEVNVHPDGRFGVKDYQLHYTGSGERFFNVFGQLLSKPLLPDQGTPPRLQLPYQSPLFGKGLLRWDVYGEGDPPMCGTGPMNRGNPVFKFSGGGLERSEAIRVVEGLRYLAP